MLSPTDCDAMFVRSSGGSLFSLSFSLASSSVLAQTAEEGGGTMGIGSVGGFPAGASIVTGVGLSVTMGSDDTGVTGALVGGLAGEEQGSVGAGSVTAHTSILITGAGLSIAMGSRMIGMLIGALRGGANGERWTPGDEEEPRANEGTAVTAVTSPPVVSRPGDFWAGGSECEL